MCFKQYTIFVSLVSLTLSERTLPLPTWDTSSNLWDPEGKNQQIGQMMELFNCGSTIASTDKLLGGSELEDSPSLLSHANNVT